MDLVRAYFDALGTGDAQVILALFEADGQVSSPLYDQLDACAFYDIMLADTLVSTIEVMHILEATDGTLAAHFRYTWTLKDGSVVTFDGADIMELGPNGLIAHLTIIYDTHAIRVRWEAMTGRHGSPKDPQDA